MSPHLCPSSFGPAFLCFQTQAERQRDSQKWVCGESRCITGHHSNNTSAANDDWPQPPEPSALLTPQLTVCDGEVHVVVKTLENAPQLFLITQNNKHRPVEMLFE